MLNTETDNHLIGISKKQYLGYDEAQNCLGVCHQYGEGVEQDDKKAFYWDSLAAIQDVIYVIQTLENFK